VIKKRPLERLPTELRELFIGLGRSARGVFGQRDTQSVFDENIDLIERLYQTGATHPIVAEILTDVGVTSSDGGPLPAGTVSSAVSRSRQRALLQQAAGLAAPGIARPVAAVPGRPLQANAERGSVWQQPAMQRNRAASDAGSGRIVAPGAQSAPNTDAAGRPGGARPMRVAASTDPPMPPSSDLAATRVPKARNSAEILNRLRSASDGET
jgi:hypothetical protein